MKWSSKKVLVTGGASFIGSHLVDSLVEREAKVHVIDDLSSGQKRYIREHIENEDVEFIKGDLRRQEIVEDVIKGKDVVFHLAADHGGRGYVDTHQAATSTNLMLDGLVFEAARRFDVEKVVYASSGCVYPDFKQSDPEEKLYLKEEDVGPPYDADNAYGWAKLMGERTLQAYHEEWGLRSASCRYFTVYGPRGKEDHAVIAMIARAFIEQDPFEVWGNGKQIRNWTYIDDIVRGTIKAAEKIDDGTAINLGTKERISVMDAVQEIMEYTGHDAEIKLLPNKPTGPVNRVCDNSLARERLGWKPEYSFREGVRSTIDWYFKEKETEKIRRNFEERLIER